MVASNKSIEDTFAVLRKHLSPDQIRAILRDLQQVNGNASFMATIYQLHIIAERRLKK